MHISTNIDLRDGSSCELTYDEENQWMRAVWLGYIDPDEAYKGASNFLATMHTFHCAYLLNDNSGLRGPWFDSVEWLYQVWAPQAARLGLRYIAHVAQPHDLLHQATVLENHPLSGAIQIQFFDDVSAAEEWLQQQHVTARTAR